MLDTVLELALDAVTEIGEAVITKKIAEKKAAKKNAKDKKCAEGGTADAKNTEYAKGDATDAKDTANNTEKETKPSKI